MNRITDPPADAGWLRALVMSRAPDDRPDAELLDRFVWYGEQGAFEAILRRHGPLVWGVCRRALGHPADADDAFQATFLVLVQKAGRVKDGGRLGPWLYGVAVRVSRRVRERAAKAPAGDAALLATLPARAEPDDGWRPVLDRELMALPAKFREPMLLCELMGVSRTAAAAQLRLREGTLSSRLARGRTLLRQRLLKHGTLLPAGGVAALLTTNDIVAVPARLLGRTAETAAQVTAAGGLLAGVVPSGVLTLTTEATGMALLKLKIGGALLLTVTAVTLGLAAGDGPPAKPDQPADPAKAVAATPEKPVAIEGDLAAMQGLWDGEEVLPPSDQPAKAATFRCLVQGTTCWIIPMGDNGYSARYELRLTQGRNPKWLDLVTDGCNAIVPKEPAGTATPGIYQLLGDGGWEFVMPTTQNRFRPAHFKLDTANLVQNVRMRRAKPPEPPTDAKVAEARKVMLGRWSITRQAYPHDNRSAIVDRPVGVVEITPEYLFIQRPASGKDFVWEAAEYRLDLSKDPKWIDLKFAGKPEENATGFGVYEQSGDTLRISYRLSVPRVFRTLEFKAGLEPQPDVDKRQEPQPACALLELKRVAGKQ